ncbi:acyl-CoA N-acyltransferase [Xylogone sp. PMI_703]|nr:acyl-CoA N-acyltransferase [Xylogone sp. PMI_703]
MATQRKPQSSSSSTSTSSSSLSQARKQFIIRPARLSDVPLLALYSREAYDDSILTPFLSPHVDKYPQDLERRLRYQIQARMSSPSSVTVVACEASKPNVPLGFGQFKRVGDDAGAKEFVRKRGLFTRFLLWAWSWWLHIVVLKIGLGIWPDRSSDKENLRVFEEWGDKDYKTYFDVDGRRVRWAAQILTVAPQWQGKGIGRLIMEVVLDLARQENVPVGLFASPDGERLYRKLGFEMIGDFCQRPPGDKGGGGIMWWKP